MEELVRASQRSFLVARRADVPDSVLPPGQSLIRMPDESEEYAARLYGMLHGLDQLKPDRILVVLPPDTDEWLGVRDRLCRAAAKE